MAVAFRASATSTGANITVPGTAVAGDVAVLIQQTSSGSDPGSVVPSGWDAVGGTGYAGTPGTRWNVVAKQLVSGDIGASVAGMDGDTDAKIMLVFSGASVASFAVQDFSQDVTGGDAASQSVTASASILPLFVIGTVGCNGAAATFSTASPAFDAEITAGNLRAGYKVYNSSPADHTIDKADQGQRNWIAGFYVELTEVTAQDVAPGLFTSTPTFYGPTATATRALTPGLFTAAGAFYAPTVGRGARNLLPGLFTAAGAFYAPTVGRGARNLTPGLFTAGQTFYGPTIGRGAVNLAAGLFSAGPTFYAATVGRGAVGIVAPLFTSSGAFYAPTVAATKALTPARVDAGQSFYAPTVGRGAVALTPGLASFGHTFYGPTVGGTYALAVGLYQDDDTFFAPSVAAGAAGIAPDRFDQESTFYGPVVSGGSAIQPARFDSAATFYDPTVSPGGVTLAADRFDNETVFFDGAVSAGGELLPALFTDEDTFYAPAVAAGAVGIEAARFDDDDTFFGPTLGLPPYLLAPDLFTAEALFFAPTVASIEAQDIAPALFVDADVFYGAIVGQGTDTPSGRRLVLGSRRRSVPADDLSRVVVLGSLGRVVIARPD